MEDNQYYFNDDESEVDEESYFFPMPDDDVGNDEEGDSDESEEEKKSKNEHVDASQYAGKMTQDEIWLCTAYDDILTAGKKSPDTALEDVLTSIVLANPKHSSTNTANFIVKDLLQKQGHARMVNSIYAPDTPLRGEDVDENLLGDESGAFNKKFTDDAREYMARFVDYLASRDLSKDSTISRKRKQRQLPALIIYLFSSGLYDLIIDCPTMPEVYANQINRALNKIMSVKYDIVEELAQRYEDAGRPQVAARVRKLQLSWFNKEPAEIRTSSEFADLNLTYDDVVIYREYRAKFTNTSKAITQDVISDLIEVAVEPGIYEKLKDKTRSDAIADVKQMLKEWSKANPIDSELASKIIWKDTE